MMRLTRRAALTLPPIRRRQDRIDCLERQLDATKRELRSKTGELAASDQQIADLKDNYEQKLRRAREEAAKWRKLTRSKVSQLEEKSGELVQVRRLLKEARLASVDAKTNSTPEGATKAGTFHKTAADIAPQAYGPSDSPLVAANTQFVKKHLEHRWLEFTESQDRRSHRDLICVAAREQGLRVRTIGPDKYFFDDEGRCIGGLQGMRPSISGVMVPQTTGSKEVLKELLQEANLPTPEWAVFSAEEKQAAFEYVRERIGSSMVTKPIDGRQGLGVTTGVTDVGIFEEAWQKATMAFRSGRVLIEEEVPGVDVRVFVVAGRALAATVRIPPFVIGDGKSTLSELVERLKVARRRHAYSGGLKLIPDQSYLARTGAYDSAVIPQGIIQFLNGTANLSQGGVPVDVTDELPEEALRLAEAAAGQVPGLHVGGIDLLMPKVGSMDGTVVLEMNGGANLRPHVQPPFGMPRDVAAPIVAEMIRKAQKPAPPK